MGLSEPQPTRRAFFSSGVAVASQLRHRTKILLRNSWQGINIGDIGHAPGALSLLNRYLPNAEVTLWPKRLEPGPREMMLRGYPRLKIVEGTLDGAGRPSNPEMAAAWAETDLYISGSGSGFPDSQLAAAFHRATGKPVGVFGVSTDPISGFGPGRDPEGGTLDAIRAKALRLPPTHLGGDIRYVADRAAFFFCRDTISVEYLKRQGARSPIVEFGPDTQLGMHLRDDAKGLAFMRSHGLEENRFICVVPRLRYTPYYKLRTQPRVPDDDVKDAINARTTDKDHAKLRDLITAYVRYTGHKVMACGEMTYQVPMAKDVLIDPLPAEIKKNVVWRDSFWLPDEAAAIYAKAVAVISVECHSPLIAYRNGTPAFYVRQPTDTCKGQMYRDIGAGEWLFEIDQTDGKQLWTRLQQIVLDPMLAKRKVQQAMATVETRQKRMVEAVREACRT